MKHKLQIKDMTLVAMFTALSAVGAFLRIPTPLVPITFQTVFTCLAGLILGKNKGCLSVGLYVLLGLFGLPIFTEGGGFHYVFNATFGYLIGFTIGAYFTGAIAHSRENPSIRRLICASMVHLVISYVVGAIYGYMVLRLVNHVEYGIKEILMAFVIPFLPKDILLCTFASVFASRLLPILKKQFDIDPYTYKDKRKVRV